MHGFARPALAAAAALALTVAVSVAFAENDAEKPEPPPANSSTPPAANPTPPAAPEMTVLTKHEVEGILGREVRSAADEDMGRIVDVLVDRAGQVRAAIIDFGGFLGVGSRKIVVDWNALHFGRVADKSDSASLDLTKEQVMAAPEYKEDAPIVVLGASGSLQPLQFDQ